RRGLNPTTLLWLRRPDAGRAGAELDRSGRLELLAVEVEHHVLAVLSRPILPSVTESMFSGLKRACCPIVFCAVPGSFGNTGSSLGRKIPVTSACAPCFQLQSTGAEFHGQSPHGQIPPLIACPALH